MRKTEENRKTKKEEIKTKSAETLAAVHTRTHKCFKK